jgi:hypothetical protein
MILVNASSKKALATTAARYVVAAIGGALVSRGIVTPEATAPFVAPVTEIVTGGILALVGLFGGLFATKKRHDEVKLLAKFVPDAVAQIK